MNLMSIYNLSPIWFQNIMTSIQGYKLKKKRFTGVYEKAVKEYLERDYSNYDKLVDYQWDRTRELIEYAINKSKFYKELYKNVDIEKVISTRDLSLLPVLEKEIVRDNIEEMYTISKNEAIVSNTSGTTGKSMCFLYTEKDIQRRMAYLDVFKMRAGFTPIKMKRASFNSSRIIPKTQKKKVFWRMNKAANQRIYSGYHCQGENIKFYVENLNEYKPQALDGYPSAIYEVAQYIVKKGVKLSFTPIAIFPTAETLLPIQKKIIEQAFGCKVYNQYASSEGAPFVTECEHGKLHVCMDTGIIEIMEDGNILVTCFETHGTPLIRYNIGDKMYLSSKKQCSCGSAMPIIERIEGRTQDYIQTPDGKRFTAVYMSLVSEQFANSIIKMQFVQNSLDSLDVYMVVDSDYSEKSDKIIIEKLRLTLGEKIKINLHKVDSICKELSGKYRYIVNNANKEKVSHGK